MTPLRKIKTIQQQSVCLLSALLLLLLSSGAIAQSFGVLFTTPEEREYLDFRRQELVTRLQLDSFNLEEDIVPDIPVVAEVVEEAVVIYQFGGIMTRINGNKMIWLNGNQVSEQDLPANFSLVNSAAGFLLNINDNANTYQLKPGQTINMQTGIVGAAYQSSNNSNETVESPASNDTSTPENASTEQLNDSVVIEENIGTENSTSASAVEAMSIIAAQDPQRLQAILEQLSQSNDLNEQESSELLESLIEQASQTE